MGDIDPQVAGLTASHLWLSWEGEPIVEDVTFSVAAGELVCLVGRSGSGKTTLFHALAGLTAPERGQVFVGDKDITGVPGSVAYMLQKDLLIPERTVQDNAALPLLLKGMSLKEARAQVASQLDRFGLEGAQGLYPDQLSGGMRQRAALLRTYLMDDPVLLMDEPFSALDALTRADMRSWFLDLMSRLGLTCMLVTHDVDEAIAMADRILVLAGNPAQGQVSRLVGEVAIECPREGRAQFMLTSDALAIKRRVLELLER